MAFWANPQTLEPLRQYRWYIDFGANSGLNENKYALKSCTKPSYKIDTTQHVLINHTFNFPKNLVWQPITAKMVAVRNDNGVSLSKVLNALGIIRIFSLNLASDEE